MSKKKTNELKPIQAELLRFIKDIDKLFRDNKLEYYAVYGTLIGAAREKGFIPWDDDIDIAMTRPMYDRLMEISRKNGGKIGNFDVACGELGNSLLPFCKIFDKRYKLNAKGVEGDEDYLFIDVFPYDAVPDDKEEYESFLRNIDKKRKLVAISRLTYKGLFDVTNNKLTFPIKALIKAFVKIFGEQRILRKYLDYCKQYKFGTTKYVSNTTWGDGVSDVFHTKNKTVKLDFEDMKISTISDWDFYLTSLYGDYMTPPKKENRVCHDIEIIKEDE